MTRPPHAVGPFLDGPLIRGELYGSAARLAQRTSALHAAKRSGAHPADVIVALSREHLPPRPRVLEVGCGRGSTTLALAEALRPSRLVVLDLSSALLRAALDRAKRGRVGLHAVGGDFHQLPFAKATFDLAAAAFCLYHSPVPELVLRELARCLRPGGTAVVATKSAGSYHELDALVAASGLDEEALSRPSLYATFHTGNLVAVAAAVLDVVAERHDRHAFAFDVETAAVYLLTNPKYELRTRDAAAVIDALGRALHPGTHVHTTSTVSYCLLRRRDLLQALPEHC